MRKINLDDTIVAISTPVGQGGIGIVRLSGKDTISIADKMFVSKSKNKPSQFKSFTMHYGWIVISHKPPASSARSRLGPASLFELRRDLVGAKATTDRRPRRADGQVTSHKIDNEVIDEALLTVMRAPRSYTKEDIVEISSHGGIVSLKGILNLAVDFGARLAEPGEFTKRAFLNGRIDLAQAEAVLDIIQSKTDAFLKVSINQLKGDLTKELEIIRENLMDIYIEIEAIINFPEEDIETSTRKQLLVKIDKAQKRVEKLLQSSEHGKILKEGIKVVICGKPNVGKSSLLNVLLKQPRAIVTDVAGTTRDTIEETAQIKGIPFQLVDTAGILEPRDLIEKEAVKRSHMYIERADLILLILDASGKLEKKDEVLISNVKDKNILVLLNKSDLPRKINEKKVKEKLKGKKILRISALKKIGIGKLQDTIVENVWHGKVVEVKDIIVSNVRHVNALKGCRLSLEKTKKVIKDGLPLEFVSEESKAAINHLDEITGKDVSGDLLDKIFSNFCIGK